jgi:hypothetical protein
MALEDMFVDEGVIAQQTLHSWFFGNRLDPLVRWLQVSHVDVRAYPTVIEIVP